MSKKSGNPAEREATYPASMKPVTFVAGAAGLWNIELMAAVSGAALEASEKLALRTGEIATGAGNWVLRGVAGSVRYVERAEKGPLDAISPPLGRAEATRAALIPIRKSELWWALPQDERRAIFEGRSQHIQASMKYLPRVARRLYHSRELGEPFDFLTWFEFAPEHAQAFEELVHALRESEEWTFVEREVDIRLAR